MRREIVIDTKNKKAIETYDDYGRVVRRDIFEWEGNDREENPDKHTHMYESYESAYGGNGVHFQNVSKEDRKLAGKIFNNKQ